MDRDPAPGDPQRVKTLARQLHKFADDVESALRLVKGMQSEEAILSWAGPSAEAFRKEFGSTPKNLGKLHTSYRIAAEALEAYWPDLDHAQYQADRALDQGHTAHAQLTSAHGGLSSAQDWAHTAVGLRPEPGSTPDITTDHIRPGTLVTSDKPRRPATR